MAQAKKGDAVKINFIGKLDDGTVFDTTYEESDCSSDDCSSDECGCEGGPMQLTIGGEEFFHQIEEALVGMAPGEKKSLVIPAEEAFGEVEEEAIFTIDRKEFPEDLVPEVDMALELDSEDGESFAVTVIEVDDNLVTVDANHPLAGENLTFDLELVEIL